MKISSLSIGQILLDGTNECVVILISNTKFEVQYISGVCVTYSQTNLDNKEFQTYIY